MISVFLYGHLAKEFGKEFRLDVKTPISAIKLLEANFPGRFQKSFLKGSFHIVRGDLSPSNSIGQGMLHFESSKDMHIMPEITGSKERGLFQTIVGVVILAAVTYATWGAGTPATGSFLGLSYGTWGSIGTSLVLSGVSTMLAGTPQLNSAFGGVNEDVDPRKSSIFTGAENVVGQGRPIPIVYGEVEVGSIVASRSLTVEAL